MNLNIVNQIHKTNFVLNKHLDFENSNGFRYL